MTSGLWLPWGKTRAQWATIGADFASARIVIPHEYRDPPSKPWVGGVCTWTLIARRPNPRATFRGAASGYGAVLDVQDEDLEAAKAEAARRFYKVYGVKPPSEVDGRDRATLKAVAGAFGPRVPTARTTVPHLVDVRDGLAAATSGKLAYFARVADVADGSYFAGAGEVRRSPDAEIPEKIAAALRAFPARAPVAGARFAMADVRAALAATDGDLIEVRSGEDGGAVAGVPMAGRRFGPAFCLKFRADLLRGALRFVGGEDATLSVTSTVAEDATLRVDGPGRLAVFMAATERRA